MFHCPRLQPGLYYTVNSCLSFFRNTFAQERAHPVWFCACQVLSRELADLKRRRAEARAENRALAKQEKTLKKRRARVLQVLVHWIDAAWGACV